VYSEAATGRVGDGVLDPGYMRLLSRIPALENETSSGAQWKWGGDIWQARAQIVLAILRHELGSMGDELLEGLD